MIVNREIIILLIQREFITGFCDNCLCRSKSKIMTVDFLGQNQTRRFLCTDHMCFQRMRKWAKQKGYEYKKGGLPYNPNLRNLV
jgi:hypothetical protein